MKRIDSNKLIISNAEVLAVVTGCGKTGSLKSLFAADSGNQADPVTVEIGDPVDPADFENGRVKQKGFTLIELLVVVVIVGIISAIAVISYSRASRLARDSVTRTRLFQVAEAQSQFRTALGRRRYARLAELAATDTPQGKLVPESVLRIDDADVSEPIDDWIIEETPGVAQTTAYLRYKFDVRIRRTDAAGSDQIFCIHEDAVERRGTVGDGCTRDSQATER